MTRRTLVVGIALLAAGAFALAAFLYQPAAPVPSATAPSTGAPSETRSLVRPHSPVLGPANAPVTIVEFFDPSCEACRAFHPVLKQIMGVYPQQVRLVLRYAAFHQGSDEAVKILETARMQNLFEPVLGTLLASQPVWAAHGAPDLGKAWEAARKAGLDVEKARRDMTAPAIDAVLKQDTADLRAYGVQQTPTFYVNGQPLVRFGAQQLFDLVKSEVEKSAQAAK